MTVFVLWLAMALAQAGGAPSVVTVTGLGAHADGTDALATTAAFQKAFASEPTGEIVVPPGRYAIDNSAGPLTIHDFGGRLVFQGAAQLVFTTNTNGGLLFEGGSGARISGLRATYARAPTVRKSPNEEVKFSGTRDTVLTDTSVENSPAAGILFFESINPTVTNASVRNSLADGLNFSNCQNGRVTNLITENTGDDGLAFVNYTKHTNLTGGLAQGILVINSKARGIAIAGQSDVIVSGFQVHNTSSSGVLVAVDRANGTRAPGNVLVENGAIYDAGTLAPVVGNHYGIEFNSQVYATFANIDVFGSGDNGLSGTAPNGSVVVSNVRVNSPRTGIGFLFYRTKNVRISGSAANETPSYGLLALESERVMVGDLTITNAGASDRLKRAVWFEDTQRILASSIHILSDGATANVIGCHTNPGHGESSGAVKTILFSSDQKDRSLSIENGCEHVVIAQ